MVENIGLLIDKNKRNNLSIIRIPDGVEKGKEEEWLAKEIINKKFLTSEERPLHRFKSSKKNQAIEI